MVIYRRQCMDVGKWPPEIPPFVQSLLIDEPLDAEEDKEEVILSIIKLHVCLYINYVFTFNFSFIFM